MDNYVNKSAVAGEKLIHCQLD